ncbi:MAG: DUF1540 domain-containing protein [Clostridia bacterium]|nr:DUF1540 domain-containing protein [Clostridia bacterium]
MEKCNNHIKCDVCDCTHNLHGRNCSLDSVKITCTSADCTCCGDFENKRKV